MYYFFKEDLMTSIEEKIQETAYFKFLERGGNHDGSDIQDWLDAEKEVLQKFGAKAEAAKKTTKKLVTSRKK
jgi:hypothetical protein